MIVLKENVKITARIENYTVKELSVAVTTHIFIGLISAIASRGIILNDLIPFGISFLGGCTPVFVPAATLGAFISYFIP